MEIKLEKSQTGQEELLTEEQALRRMRELVASFEAALKLAEAHADKYKLSFSIYPAYGMGGTYEGDPEQRYREWGDGPPLAWRASSQSC